MARSSRTELRIRVHESETPAPDRVQRGLALWGEYLLRHLTTPPSRKSQKDHPAELR